MLSVFIFFILFLYFIVLHVYGFILCVINRYIITNILKRLFWITLKTLEKNRTYEMGQNVVVTRRHHSHLQRLFTQ